MADLMEQKTTLAALEQKYENFMVPAVRIRVNGKDVAGNGGAVVESLRVKLALDDSGSADFTLTHVYDSEKRSFAKKVKDLVMLGSLVKIEIGYGSSLEEVFAGFIYNIHYQVGEMPSLSVAVMDLRRLMAENQKSYYTYSQKSSSDVVMEILKTYQPMFSKAVITKTKAEEDPDFEQNGSDLDFIQTLCRRSNREFLVCGSKVYFRKPRSVDASIVTLENGRSLLAFSREMIYKDETIHVVVRKDDKEVLRESEKVKTGSAEVRSLNIPIQKYIVESDIKTREKAKDRLAKEIVEVTKQCQAGSGSCIGLPDLVPGRYIEIAKVDAMLDGKYYLKSVEHQWGSDGYQTSFEVGGYDT